MKKLQLVKLKEAFLFNIDKIMKSKNLSQSDLARMMGISRQHISKLLKEDTDMQFSTVSKLAEALEIEETDLVDPKLKVK